MESKSSGGVGLAGLMTVAFIVLKLTNFIDWGWVWVISPMWISMILEIIITILMTKFGD